MALIIARGINGLRPLSLRPLSLSSSKRPPGVGLARGEDPHGLREPRSACPPRGAAELVPARRAGVHRDPRRATGSGAGAGVPGLSRAPKGESAGGAPRGREPWGKSPREGGKGLGGGGCSWRGAETDPARPPGAMLELRGPAVLGHPAEAILRGGG